ncbi:MAG: glutathione S-transferase [Methylobacter sp.]|nr:MAG: glutathione S-transferase [Methylobacter sp.]
MRLIGMLDSPYVRRVAVSLEALSVPFTHEAVSVFSTFEQFKAINPVVKAPSLVCDDGEVLMDSSLILQFIEATAANGRSLWSNDPNILQHQFRAVSLALAACEKSVQIVYERNLRPVSAQYEPWIGRVSGQLLSAYGCLESEVRQQTALFSETKSQAAITAAIVWQFSQSMLANLIPVNHYPGLADLSARMEKTKEFLKFPPIGPGV